MPASSVRIASVTSCAQQHAAAGEAHRQVCASLGDGVSWACPASPARSRGQAGDAVQGARVQVVVAQARATASAASVPLPEAVGPSTQITGMCGAGRAATENSASK
jgi:hypothetical protein